LQDFHASLRAPTDAPLDALIRATLARLPSSQRRGLTIDIDPMSMA
jgi:hypothetical protein